jgi:HSP20 family molecular chaperone IbpA
MPRIVTTHYRYKRPPRKQKRVKIEAATVTPTSKPRRVATRVNTSDKAKPHRPPVPGIAKSDLEIQVKGNIIRLAGAKSVNYPEKASLHRRERLAGRFDRAVTLPVEIDADGVKAECRDGILALFLPRAERDKPKSIRIA